MSENYGRTRLLVVQPTPFCNIDCAYCYLPHRSETKRLSFEAAELVFKNLFSFPTVREEVTIVWHAGEPLVLPVEYYERMFEMIRGLAPAGLRVHHSFQTNGTLITERWCDLITKWKVFVGLSLDGPRDLHDLYRKHRNGTGSFERSFQGLRTLQRAGIPFHVITVLTVESLREPERLFEFYADNSIEYVCFNIEEQEGNHFSKLVSSKSAEHAFRDFFSRFVDLTIQRRQPIGIREVDSCLRAIQGHGNPIRNEQAEPFGIISVDCEGNVSTFSPELLGMRHEKYGSFSFGNLIEHGFDEIRANIENSKLYADIKDGIRQCRASCDYYGVCGGGPPANKIYENGLAASTETLYCRTLMRATDVVLDMVDRIPGVALEASSRQPAVLG